MTSVAHPAGEGSSSRGESLDQGKPLSTGEAPLDTAAAHGAADTVEPPSASKKPRRGGKEVAALGQLEVGREAARPSRRAANAAQVAIAQGFAFEQQKGTAMSPPRPAEQLLAMRLMESTVEHAAAEQTAAAAQLGQQQEAAAAAAHVGPADAAAARAAAGMKARGGGPSSARSGAAAATSAAAATAVENGKSPTKKRKWGAADATLSGSAEAAAGDAAEGPSAAAGAGAVAGTPAVAASGVSEAADTPAVPSAPVDLPPFVDMARECESQEELKQQLVLKFPPTRGRSPANQAFRDLFLTLCPGQTFHNRQSAQQHVTYRLFQLAGKNVGKAPAHYKPRGPRTGATPGSPTAAGAAAAAAAAPLGGSSAAPPAAAAADGAALGPAAAELGGGGEAARGPAAAAAARAAAAAAAGEPGGGVMSQASMSAVLADYPPELVRIAALVRRSLGMTKGCTAHLRMMLKTNHLAGQDVRFQTKAGKLLNTGRLNDQGGITCYCKQCSGKNVSASEFEEHSGSKDRRPADGIFLEGTNRSLKDLLLLVNSPDMAAMPNYDVHMEVCYACNEGGDMLCCDGCTAAYHLGCVNLDAVPQADWFCPCCQAEGRTTKPEPMLPLQPKQLSLLKPPKGSGRGRPSSTSKSGKQKGAGGIGSGGGGGSGEAAEAGGSEGTGLPPPLPRPAPGGGSGRVHMAAPTAPRAPRLTRPGARSNKNKRLFEGEEGALLNGQKLYYKTTQGEVLLEGVAVVERGGPSGILCSHCNTCISASGFEAHAGRGQRRAPYDNIFTEDGLTLKAIAALLPDLEDDSAAQRGEYGLDELADDAREVISELDTLAGGCVLCHEVDFQRGGFGARTIMLCDQCEREFHVGCLKKCGKCELDAVPEGDWYCSEECERIRCQVSAAAQGQQMDIPGFPSHTWQVMRGKDGRTATAWSLRAAQEILQESFDPIMDLGSNTDLLPVMLYARRAGEWDYSNCLTLLLRHKGKPVVAAIVRVFGPQMAELPLIATKNTARRQGHARVLVDCFQRLLKESGVHTLVLPAAHETVETWKSGFQFVDMPEDDVRLAKQQLRILIFPGTEVLWKHFPEVKAPEGHHILVPPPDRPSPEEAADAMEVAAITANMVACVAAACGEPVLPETLGIPMAAAADGAAAAAGSGSGGGGGQEQQQGRQEEGGQLLSATTAPREEQQQQQAYLELQQQQQAVMTPAMLQQQQMQQELQLAQVHEAGAAMGATSGGGGNVLQPLQDYAAAMPYRAAQGAPPAAAPAADEYEEMIAAAMAAADRQVTAASGAGQAATAAAPSGSQPQVPQQQAWLGSGGLLQQPAYMDVDGGPDAAAGGAQQQQQQHGAQRPDKQQPAGSGGAPSANGGLSAAGAAAQHAASSDSSLLGAASEPPAKKLRQG